MNSSSEMMVNTIRMVDTAQALPSVPRLTMMYTPRFRVMVLLE